MPTYNIEKVAQIGYKAYGESTGGKNFQGDDMPIWHNLPLRQRVAWMAATEAITCTFNRFLIEAQEER